MNHPSLLGSSSLMRQVHQLIDQVARQGDSVVLVVGESGTGKARVAECIHRQSSVASGPFITLSCSRVSGTQLANEFPGILQRAHGGTLYLEEVCRLSPEFQRRLQQVLADPRTPSFKDRVRLIASSSQNLETLVRRGAFSQELWRRLSATTVRVPALRERKEDIPVMAEAFLNQGNGQARGFTPTALDRLTQALWKGNVKELEDAVARCARGCDKEWIDEDHLPFLQDSGRHGHIFSRNMTLRELNRLYAQEVLNRVRTKAEVCSILGITDKTLNKLLKEASENR